MKVPVKCANRTAKIATTPEKFRRGNNSGILTTVERTRKTKGQAKFSFVPLVLKALPNWILWRYEADRSGRHTKVPINALDDSNNAKTNDPNDWVSFNKALAAYNPTCHAGLGFVFDGSGIVGIDLDDCRNADTEAIEPWAQEIISAHPTYWEVSPSGTGLKGFMKAHTTITGNRKKYENGEVEMYATGRYFAFTGWHFAGTPKTINDCTTAFNELHKRIFGDQANIKRSGYPAGWINRKHDPLEDNELLERLFSEEERGKEWQAAYEEGQSLLDKTGSEDDGSFLRKLAYYSGCKGVFNGHAQIERIMLGSALLELRKSKWFKRTVGTTWLRNEIAKACAKETEKAANPVNALNALNILDYVVGLDTIESKPVEWLWRNRIPLGKISVLSGDPDLGKTTLAIYIAACLSRGKPLPRCKSGIRGTTLMLTAEDDAADTIRPRFEAAGGDPNMIKVMLEIPHRTQNGNELTRLISLPGDVSQLRRVIEEHDIKLVIIDPMNAFLSGRVDAHSDHDIRLALSPLKRLAEDTGAAILLIRHLNKSGDKKAMYRGGGSIGVTGAARAEFLCAVDKDDPDCRVLAAIKSNLCEKPESLRFRFDTREGEVAHIIWLGTSEYSANDLVSHIVEKRESVVDNAMTFLNTALANGRRKTVDIYNEAQEANINLSAIKRASSQLRLEHKRIGGAWYMSLPVKSSESNSSDADRLIKHARVKVKLPARFVLAKAETAISTA